MSIYYILTPDREVQATSDTFTWAKQMERPDRVVAQTPLLNGLWVSTVFLGLDHRFTKDGPPLVFETMVFDLSLPTSNKWSELDCRRYSTWTEAEQGHWDTCALWAKGGSK